MAWSAGGFILRRGVAVGTDMDVHCSWTSEDVLIIAQGGAARWAVILRCQAECRAGDKTRRRRDRSQPMTSDNVTL